MRILAIDYGDRRVGMAISDELGMTAHGLATIEVRSQKQAANAIARIAMEHDADKIVIGLPFNMDGSSGERADMTQILVDLCSKRTNLPIETFDERMSSIRANNALKEMGVKKHVQRNHIDRVAATIILQDYLLSDSTGT